MQPARKLLGSAKMPGELDSGAMHVWIAEKLEVIVFRNAGRIRIFSSICPHMGAQLQCHRNNSIACPWHGLCFKLGQAKGEVESNHRKYRRIREYEGEIVNGELRIYE